MEPEAGERKSSRVQISDFDDFVFDRFRAVKGNEFLKFVPIAASENSFNHEPATAYPIEPLPIDIPKQLLAKRLRLVVFGRWGRHWSRFCRCCREHTRHYIRITGLMKVACLYKECKFRAETSRCREGKWNMFVILFLHCLFYPVLHFAVPIAGNNCFFSRFPE